ncbi:methyltransferase domain-containing protein [Candidatus Woesearchaeota archaeon]|jgi:SAM-dependent methyltransferase|nr:methyltransferase domain-containing protein [Candidatus Woesearchaeota archaeon]MBT7367621.1 methyltransferase domain-containing protein [Candidatus Woesearchaeota archaeon]
MKKLLKFGSGSIFSYSIKLGVTPLLTELFHVWYFYSYIISMVLVILFSFFYNMYVTYQITTNKTQNFVKYTFFLTMFMVLDAILVKTLTDIGLFYIFSIIIVTTALFFVKYIVYDKMVFTKKIKNKNVAGNYYNKHNSKNPLIKFLMNKFHTDLFKLIKKTKSNQILDVGCGEGYTTRLIKKKFKKVNIQGIELEQKALKIAQRENKKLKFKQGSIYSIKDKDKSFDLVIATEVLEHLEKPKNALTEVKRISKKYGIFTVPYEPFWRIANIARGAYLKDLGNTPGHIQHWSKRSFRKMLKKEFKKVTITNSTLWIMAVCEK